MMTLGQIVAFAATVTVRLHHLEYRHSAICHFDLHFYPLSVLVSRNKC